MAFEMSGGFRDSDGFVKIAAESSEDNHDALIVAKKPGKVRFVELDAETMGDWFAAEQTAGKADSYDAVWISEALSHFPNKPLFFQNAARMLRAEGGKVVVADWFRDEDLSEEKVKQDIRPIEGRLPTSSRDFEYRCYGETDRRRRNAPTASVYAERVRGLCRRSRLSGLCGADGHQQAGFQDLVRQPIPLSSF